MPVYDYVCQKCHQRFDIFMTYAEYGSRKVSCLHCGSREVRRRMARVRVAKSEQSRMESLAGDLSDPSALAGLENDPKALGHMMRKMGSELGDEVPPEFNEVVSRLEKGQSPEEIEKEIPDLGGDSSDDGSGGEDSF